MRRSVGRGRGVGAALRVGKGGAGHWEAGGYGQAGAQRWERGRGRAGQERGPGRNKGGSPARGTWVSGAGKARGRRGRPQA